MSDNYMNYSNAEEIFGGYAQSINKIKPTPITYAAYQALSAEEKAANRYMITDYPDQTGDYNDLTNRPHINNVTLAGNKSAHDLGLVAAETGKGLSSNDYTTAEKTKLAGLENYDDTVLAGRVSDVESVIPSNASSINKLATADDVPDTTDFIQKSVTVGLVKNDGTIDTNTYVTAADISGKADKSEMSIVDGSGASADKTTITLKSGTSATVLKEHQDISGKAEKSEMSVTPGTGANADKTTIQLKEGTSATVLTVHQDLSGKVDKVSGATNGNFAGLNAGGEVVDSGKKASDFSTPSDIQNVYEVMGKNGAKNLIPHPYSETFPTTSRGIAFSENSDGSISFSGTADDATVATVVIVGASKGFFLPAGTYKLTGGSSVFGGTFLSFYDDSAQQTPYSGTYTGLNVNSGYVVLTTTENGETWTTSNPYGYEKLFTINSGAYVNVQVRSINNTYANSVSGTIYPMLRFASDPDDTYAPYAETNKQLTDRPREFVGTQAEWTALSSAEKAKYTLVNITDDSETGDVVDAVTDGDLRPVTSNAVFDELSFTNHKTAQQMNVSISATYTDVNIPITDAKYGIITGVSIGSGGAKCIPIAWMFSSLTNIFMRISNVSGSATTCNITVNYL